MKTKFFAIAAISALFAVSCTETNLQTPVNSGEEVVVSFVANAPEAIATKAYSDGLTAKNLYYAVYAEDDKTVLISGETTFTNLKAKVELTLVTAKKYDIIFWAQNEAAPYTFDMAAQTVTVDYSNVVANTEALDAFYYIEDSYLVAGPKAEDVKLRRPFAQINVGTNDTADAAKAGYTATHTNMVVANVPNVLDLHTGAVSGEEDVTFTKAAIPAQQAFPVSGYDYLAMNYILASADNATTNVDFVIYGENEIPFNLSNVPVRRNYRTNIYGALLTNPTVWNVEIVPGYETPDHEFEVWTGELEEVTPDTETNENGETVKLYEVSNGAELAWVAEQLSSGADFAGATIKLTDDIALGADWAPINLWNPDKATVATIDGNGKTISGLSLNGAGSLGFIGSYASSSVLTIKDLTFEAPVLESSASFVGTVVGYTYGNITLDNVKVTGADIKTTAERGIRIGGLVGLYPADAAQPLVLNECVVENSVITGFHNLAGLVGSTMGSNATMTNCKSNNNTFYHRAENKASWQNFDANGYAAGKAVKTGCTAEGNKGYQSVADGVLNNADGVYEISSAAGLIWFAEQVNAGSTFAGKTLALVNSIDLEGASWTPIGKNADDAAKFQGTFDGKGNSISNFTVKQDAGYHAAGLFGALNGTVQNLIIDRAGIESISAAPNGVTSNGTAIVAGSIYSSGLIKNVTVKNSSVKGNRYVGGIAGYVYGKIESCMLESTDVTAACDDLTGAWDNGDKVGGIAGYFPEDSDNYIRNCSVKNVNIKAYRDLGGIVGFAADEVSGCSVENVTLTVDKTYNYKNYTTDDEFDAGSIVGEGTSTSCTGEAVINY